MTSDVIVVRRPAGDEMHRVHILGKKKKKKKKKKKNAGESSKGVQSPWTGAPPSGVSVGEEFVVKVQIPIVGGKLMVYDKTRTLMFDFDVGQCERIEALVSQIRSKGWGKPNGMKAYMLARVTAEGTLEVFWRRLKATKRW